jgi:hypothetical protein
MITIDHQRTEQQCSHCGHSYENTRGSAYKNGEGFSIYLAALHSCSSQKMAHLAIAIREGFEGFSETCAVCIHIRVMESEFQMAVVDSELSPWKNEKYLGRILERDEAIATSMIDAFFHVADHIVSGNPTINAYFSDGLMH